MPIVKVEIWGYQCLNCEHTWVPRGVWKLGPVKTGKPSPKPENLPPLCPHCKSPFWHRPKPEAD